MASVSLEQVTREYRGRRGAVRAVDRLSLDIADGEYVVLLGPSGCGKTTTLRLVAGLESPDEGTIRMDGAVANRVAPKDRDVAMVFQSYALYPHMTVFNNLAFGLKMRRTPKAEIARRVQEAARRLAIDHLLERRPAALSGGEMQRVALGRAIVRKPRLFLFDEPLSNLDVGLRLRARADLRTLQRELATTVLHVTHDQEEAMTLGDRIAVLRDGRLQQYSPPLELYRRPANRFVAEFIGTPPMNLMPGRLQREAGGVGFKGSMGTMLLPPSVLPTTLPRESDGVLLGLRPQHVSIAGTQPGPPEAAPLRDYTIRHVESLGDCVNVHLLGGDGSRWIARAPTDFSSRDSKVDLQLDITHAHLFAGDEQGARLN